jgi:hypothetical protein
MNMNQSHNPTTKTTLAEALSMSSDEREIVTEGANVNAFGFSAAEQARTIGLFLYLARIPKGSPLEAVAIRDVLENPDLFVMLNAPAREFVGWWRREDWSLFNLSNMVSMDTHIAPAWVAEEWARNVLVSALAMCAEMGWLGAQMPLKQPS